MYVSNMSNCNAAMFLNGNLLPVVDSVRDLGVIVDSQLSFAAHIDQVVARAFTRANLIHKCFISRDTATLKRAFLVYVRPLLEYASCVWSPHHIGKIKHVESVQRQFTKRLPGFADLEYKERLSRLNLESLEMRRLRQDLLYTYKIVFGLVSDACSDLFILTNSVTENAPCTRGHYYKLFPSFKRVDTRKFFFAERVILPWNSLPAEYVHFSKLSVFKRFLRSVDLSRFVSLGF